MVKQSILALTCAVSISVFAADIHVTLDGVNSADGKVLVALYDKSGDFPTGGKWLKTQTVNAGKGAVSVEFKEVTSGRYAVSAFHDVNDNGRMDKNMLGIPSEPNGVSRNVRGLVGPPKFEDAAVNVDASNIDLMIHLK
jgi:uncharacterized protein (DUF2141 family)